MSVPGTVEIAPEHEIGTSAAVPHIPITFYISLHSLILFHSDITLASILWFMIRCRWFHRVALPSAHMPPSRWPKSSKHARSRPVLVVGIIHDQRLALHCLVDHAASESLLLETPGRPLPSPRGGASVRQACGPVPPQPPLAFSFCKRKTQVLSSESALVKDKHAPPGPVIAASPSPSSLKRPKRHRSRLSHGCRSPKNEATSRLFLNLWDHRWSAQSRSRRPARFQGSREDDRPPAGPRPFPPLLVATFDLAREKIQLFQQRLDNLSQLIRQLHPLLDPQKSQATPRPPRSQNCAADLAPC